MIRNKVATIFGGTGFVGRQIVRELAEKGYTIKVGTRVPERAYFLKPAGSVGQIVPFQCDYNDPVSIENAVSGAEIVVNCVAILYERGKNKFEKIHVELAENIAKACKKEGVERFVHISALGVEKGTSQYAKSKLEGEKRVFKAFADATILRPSVIFGEDDSFFNMFAEMARFAPALPLIGGGKTRFQPVFVGDVADAVIAVLRDSESVGQIYELGGPEIVSFKDIYERLFKYTGRSKPLVNVPFAIAKLQGAFLQFFPQPPLTPDQVESLKTDTIVSKKALTFDDLGISPKTMDLILPEYLESYRNGGRFADMNAA